MADIDFKNSVNADSAYVENHKVQLIAIPDGDLELPLSPNDDSGYVVDANGKKHKVMLATFLTSDQDIEYKNGVNANSAYMTVDGQKVKVTLAAKLNGTQRLFDSPNASDAYVEDEDGNEHRTMLVATPEGTLKLPTSETYNYAYVVDVDGNKHRVRMFTVLAGGQAYVEVTVKGVSPLSLPDAIANSLSYVKAFGGTEQRNLPDNYIERQFIYMMDGSYLLTDIVPTFAGHYELEMQTTSVTGTPTTYLGGRNESSGNGGLRFAHISDKSFRILGFGNASTLSNTAANNTKYKFIWDNGSFWVYSGTTLIHSETFTEETLPTTTPLAINGWNSGGTITTNTEGIYLYSFKAWNAQGELVADYVPAVQKGTVPVVGFYDTVSKTFKTATAGTFAAGGEAVPTPDTPMDIVSNNGVLKFTANEANYIADNVTLGYWLRNSNGQPEASPANFYTAMMPVKPNTSYVCFGYTKDTNVISGYNRIAWYDADGVWIRNSTYTQNQPGIDVAPSNAAFARFHCNINGTDVTQDLVDSYNWVFQQGTAEVPYTPYSPTKVYTTGPIETIAIKDDQDATVSTAICEDLLSIGTYTDEQEIISGVVTRKVGVKVLDGTENIGKSGTYAGSFFVRNVVSDWGTSNNAQVYCSHFSGVTADTDYVQNKCMILNNAFNMWWASDNTPTVAQFQQWLANQYAAGTPVIVVFPLATQTTDTVTPQPMQTAAGDNTAEITQASLNGLELEAEYQAAVSLTIQEVQDANLDPNVQVTIN